MASQLTTELKVQGEYDFNSEEQSTDVVTTVSATEESTVSGTSSSDETATTGSETIETSGETDLTEKTHGK